MMRRRPNVFAGAFGSAVVALGLWNFVSSSRPWPSGVRTSATSARTSSSPTTRATHSPSTAVVPPSSQLHADLDEEGDGSFEVVDDDTDMVHPLDRHVTLLPASEPEASQAARLCAQHDRR
jgi:hypothetical protein